jgi:hypothetical protein
MRRIVFLLSALLLVIFLTGCGSPEQSVRLFLKYFIRQDIDAAMLYTTDPMDARIERGEITNDYLGFRVPMGGIATWGSVKNSLSFTPDTKTEDKATLVYKSSFGDVYYHLRLTGGMWKIENVEGLLLDEMPAPDAEGTVEDLTGMIEDAESE